MRAGVTWLHVPLITPVSGHSFIPDGRSGVTVQAVTGTSPDLILTNKLIKLRRELPSVLIVFAVKRICLDGVVLKKVQVGMHVDNGTAGNELLFGARISFDHDCIV